jgi:squalene cyclase
MVDEQTATARDFARLDAVLGDACRRLFAEQQTDGTWHGAIMYNAWTNGMYCILHRLLGLQEPTTALDWLEAHRCGLNDAGHANGTWGMVDIPSLNFLEGTIAAEIALEIWGRPRHAEAWAFIDEQATGRLANAISLADPFTQTFAALASEYAPGDGPYFAIADVLAPPLELLLLPRVINESVPRLAGAWGQDALVGLMVIATIASGRRLLLPEQALLKKAEAHLLTTQNSDGSWYATFLPTIAGTIAMHLLGYDLQSKVMQGAIGFLQRLERSDGYVARYKLPVWDTSIAILGLVAAGVDPASEPLRRAGEYLMESQAPDGGIPFQRENVHYPDTDDTSFAIIALEKLRLGDREPQKRRVIERALRWLIYMQGDDGGWAAFAKDQAKAIKGLLPMFKDDPPTADVTGHVLSALPLARATGVAGAAQQRAARGIGWLETMQMNDGQWFGRWGLTFTYGTAAVLQGTKAAASAYPGAALGAATLEAAVEYLLSTQQPDGGWGEGYTTYYDFQAEEQVPSTVEQTAWSVLGLLAAPPTAAAEAAVERGIDFILAQYDPVTGWPNDAYSVGAIWVYRNALYSLLWGVWALAEYALAKQQPATSGQASVPVDDSDGG